MSKYCKNCGSPLKAGAKFCASCGAAVDAPHRQETVRAAPSAQNNAQTPDAENTKRSDDRNTGRLKKLLIPEIAFLIIAVALVIAVPRLFDSSQNSAGIESVTGQPYAGRAATINGEGFGYYDPENCRVTIDGKDTPIISWGENEVVVIVPAGVTAGKKEVLLSNPPAFDKKSIETEFMEHKKIELASVTLSPSEDNRIERDGFTLIVPAGSVAEEKKIIIYKYDAPAIDDSPYYMVTDEYEITGSDGEHVFFDHPVLFGLDVKDEEEALQTSFQIFDEFAGLWAKAETVYVEKEGKLYLATNHFSGFRRFVSVMYQGSKKMVGEAVEAGKKGVDYIYKSGKAAKDTVVKLGEEAWVAIKDATVEDFVGVSDADNNFIIYYRVADAKNDASIPDKAREMAAAFSTAYNEYKALFGEANVPPTTRRIYLAEAKDITIPDPIRVYIDPRYTGALAKTATTGNIIMPAEYHEGDLASTCAHELFHVVQYHQLGLKQLYMGTTGLKDLVDNRYTGNSTEVYRFFANNMWFFEATAEYAGRFIGTNEGIGAPIHRSIDASKPYYAYNGYHEYGVSSFLDYILSTRQPGADTRGEAFKEMWNTVTGNYSMASSINVSFDGYVWDKLNESADAAYLNFWREAFTRSYMPEVDNIAGGLIDVMTLNALKISSSMPINEKGTGIFRYNLQPKFMREDKTALTRSFWFEASPASMAGDVYRLGGLEMHDRVGSVDREPFEGSVNMSDKGLQDVLVPYTAGDSFGLIALFYNSVLGDANAKVTLASTSVTWDNQKDIEKKVGNATLKGSDKLKFTPTLPEQKPGDPPFTAVVTLNNNEDYKTELDRVENGKSFEVTAPMKEIPPDKVSVNIKIFKERKLVHEYQSGELAAEAMVYIKGSGTLVVELTKDELPYTHQFTAEAWPEGEYSFRWAFANGATKDETAKNESSVAADYNEFKKYEPYVTLYDLKGNKLATAKVSLTLKEKEAPPPPPKTEGTGSAEPSAEPQQPKEKEYAWILVDVVDCENAEGWALYDAHPCYAQSHSYSRGSYSASETYEGRPGCYQQEAKGTLGLQAIFTGMPEIIYPDKPVSLKFSFTTTQNDVVKWTPDDGNAYADFQRWDLKLRTGTGWCTGFTNADGKYYFVLDVNGNPSSYSETLTATLHAGKEGDGIALRTGFYLGLIMETWYIYEWKQVGSSTPLLDTEGIPGIIDID